tara:strand:+ start:1558 stop:1797 length:240 start_codon:yes stop_codon:yes gene_type:complete
MNKKDKELKKIKHIRLHIEAKKNETVDSMLRRFKKNVKLSGLMKEIKDRSFYEKPSVTKRKKAKSLILRKKHLKASFSN